VGSAEDGSLSAMSFLLNWCALSKAQPT